MSCQNNDQEPIRYRIRDMESNERPRERLMHAGAGALLNAELIDILLRVGIAGNNAIDLANHLLIKYDGLNGLRKATFDQLKNEKGIGEAKAAQILAAIELGNRISMLQQDSENILISSPEDVFHFCRYQMSALDHEELWVINLDTKHRVIKTNKLYKGSLNTSSVRIAEIFREPIQRNAAAILLVHNHPSGDSKPSPADIEVTRRVREAGEIFEIRLLDHVIIGAGQFQSIMSYL